MAELAVASRSLNPSKAVANRPKSKPAKKSKKEEKLPSQKSEKLINSDVLSISKTPAESGVSQKSSLSPNPIVLIKQKKIKESEGTEKLEKKPKSEEKPKTGEDKKGDISPGEGEDQGGEAPTSGFTPSVIPKIDEIKKLLKAVTAGPLKRGGNNISRLATSEKEKDDADKKLAQAEKVVVPPSKEASSKSQAKQVVNIDEVKEPEPNALIKPKKQINTKESEGTEKLEKKPESEEKPKKGEDKKGDLSPGEGEDEGGEAPISGFVPPVNPKIDEIKKHLKAVTAGPLRRGGNNISKLAVNEKEKDDADKKLAQAEKAVVPPAKEASSKSQAKQVENIDEVKEPEPKEEKAKKTLDKTLKSAIPKSLDEMGDFKDNKKAQVIGDAVKSMVESDTQDVKSTYEKIEDTPAEPSIIPATPLPDMETPLATPPLQLSDGLVGEVPSGKADFSEFENQSDDMLKKEGITEEQLESVTDGELAEANKNRKGLKEKTKKAPDEIKQTEQTEKADANKKLQKEEAEGRNTMRSERDKALKNSNTDQKGIKLKSEKKRDAVTIHINTIYEKANTTVKQKLEDLEKKSLKSFDDGQKKASTEFENNVNRRLDAFKDVRYSGLFGWTKWLKDKVLGMEDLPEVEKIFNSEKKTFEGKLESIINKITKENKKVIQDCKIIIKRARITIDKYVKGLGPALKDIGLLAQRDMKKKLDALDKTVNKKEKELKAKLEEKRKEAIKAIEKKIEKMKEAMSGLLSQLFNFLLNALIKFVKWVLKAAGLDSKQLFSILNKGKIIIKKIVSDPIGFIMNIINSVKSGIGNFIKNIKKHLISGLISWLTGAMGDLPIQLPEKFDLKGILSLVLQILGLTWTNLRKKLVKRLGEKVVAVAETTVDIVKRVIAEGPMALWEMLKEKASEIKNQVMNGIRNWVIVTVVKQGMIKLLSFLNPAGAFVQAVIAIYNTVMFFVENWSRIVEMVKTVFGSIADIARGKISAAANAVEKSLAMTIPIILGFLARLIGLGGIGKAVKKIIMKVRKPIDKVLDKVVGFVAKKAKKFLKKGKNVVKKGVAKVLNWWKGKKAFKTKTGYSHSVRLAGSSKSPKLEVASGKYHSLKERINEWEKKAKSTEKIHLKKAANLAEKLQTYIRKENSQIAKSSKNNKSNSIYKKEMEKRLKAISVELAKVNLDETKLPPSKVIWTMNGNRAGTVTADPLSKVPGNTKGSPPRGTEINGWEYVKKLPNYNVNWVRLHLLNDNLHGPGKRWNLTPGTKETNTAKMLNQIETPAKQEVDKNEVLKYETKVTYGHSGGPKNSGAAWKKAFGDFPSQISMKYSILKENNKGNWIYDKKGKPKTTWAIKAPPNLDDFPMKLNSLKAEEINFQLGLEMNFAKSVRQVLDKGATTTKAIKQGLDTIYTTATQKSKMAKHWKRLKQLIDDKKVTL